MNPWQMAQQIKHKLTTVAWTVGSTDVVFGTRSVRIFAGTPTEDQIPAGFPWCLVSIDSGSSDEDHPEFITQNYTVLSAAEVAGDAMGETAIIGSSVAELGKSVGRGIGEIEERVRSAVQDLVGADGATIMLSLTTTGAPTSLGAGRHIVLAEHSISALCTSSLHYAAPQKLVHASGAWSWAGTHCSERFDFKQFRLVKKGGSSPSTSPSDGTTVYTGTAATSGTLAATSSNTYTVFADYSSRKQSGVIEGSSDVEVGSYKAVS